MNCVGRRVWDVISDLHYLFEEFVSAVSGNLIEGVTDNASFKKKQVN